MIQYWVVLALAFVTVTTPVRGAFLYAEDPPTGRVRGRGDLGLSEAEYEDAYDPFFNIDWDIDDVDQFHGESDISDTDGVEGPDDIDDVDDDDENEEIDDSLEERERDLKEKEYSFKKRWLTHMRLMRENNKRWRRMMQRALHGQWDVNPYFNVNWDLRFLSEQDKWWNGPNVCKRTEEEEEDLEDEESSIVRHHMISSSVCDDTGTVYKCTTTVQMLSKKKKMSVIYECCHGYQREQGKSGCTKELPMLSLLETLEDLGANEMLDAISGIPLTEFLENGNFTIFAPKGGIMGQFKPIQDNEPNVVVITPGLVEMAKELEETVMAHIVSGHIKTAYVEDEQLIPTLSQGNNIRINIYERPKSLVTANCRPVVSSDNLATNGVVHIVDGILTPVKESIASIVSKNPDLSMFKTVLGQSGLLSMLKSEGQYTLMAPSNSAFNRLDPDVRRKLLSGQQCIKEVIRNHLLPNVICSSILEGKLLTLNALNKYLNVTRTEDEKLFVENAQVLETDIMATNGVIHVIDDVLIPEEALTLLEVAEHMEDNTFLNLVKKAGLTKKLNQLHNYTLFLPTPEAFKDVPEDTMNSLLNDTNRLSDVLLYHLLPSMECDGDLEDKASYQTLLNGKQLTVRNFKNFPFGLRNQKTVQCAAIEDTNAGVCGGIIHFIDRMMIPPTGNVFDLLQERSEFSQLVKLMKDTGLADTLQEEGPFTIFAPTNKAFASLGEVTTQFLKENPDKLKGLLKHHITRDAVCCSGVFSDILSETRSTLDGRVILTNRRGSQVVVNQIPIKHCDRMATNGIVHSIDKLLPEALNRYVTRHMRHNGRLNWHMHFGGDDFGKGFEDYVQGMLERMFGIRRSRIRREPRQRDDGGVAAAGEREGGRKRTRNAYWDGPGAREPERMWDNWRQYGQRKRKGRSADGGEASTARSADEPETGSVGLASSSSSSHWPGHYRHHWPSHGRHHGPHRNRDYWPSTRPDNWPYYWHHWE